MRFDDHRVGVIFPQMSDQVALLHERFIALRTCERFFPGVGASVRDEVALADKVLGTEIAAEGTFGGRALVVAALVEQQVALQRERLAAFAAGERALAAVRPADVVDQVLLVVERLVAHVAGVRRVARVLAQVVRQVLLPRERLLAKFTPMR